jgi:outer membrane lipoprotein-sorting protein
MFKLLSLFCFITVLFSGCVTERATNINPVPAENIFQLDERYADNGTMNGNHTIVYFSGNLSTLEEIKGPLLRGFEQAHIIAEPNDNLIVLFVNEEMALTLYFSERDYYLSFINGTVSESEFIQYVSTKYIIE